MEDDINKLNINEKFKSKFEHEQKRKILDQVKEKYGKKALLSDTSSSESESEDSEAELVNKNVLEKFVNIYTDLKTKNKKELLKADKDLFDESDFVINKKKNEKPEYTIKDAILNQIDGEAAEDANNFDSLNFKPKIKKDKFKDEFIQASKVNDSDDFLKLKSKGKDDMEINEKDKEKKASKNKKLTVLLNDKRLEDLDSKEIAECAGPDFSENLVNKMLGNTEKLSARDKFLRNYLITEAWKDKDEEVNLTINNNIDEEDEVNSDIFDNFEAAFNFRFQEDGGANITTHKRHDESIRVKDNKRAEKRKETNERKKIETNDKLKEINQARKIVKEQMESKVNDLLKISGQKHIKESILTKLYEELDKEDFDPDRFDCIMSEMYDSNYYKLPNPHEEEKMVEEDLLKNKETLDEIEDGKNLNLDLNLNESKGDKQKKLKNQEENSMNENEDNNQEIDSTEEESESVTEWWYCDKCKNVIKPGKIMYMDESEEITYCKSCYKNAKEYGEIQVKMKKNIVPLNTKVSILNYFVDTRKLERIDKTS